jgi:hypothetical protein
MKRQFQNEILKPAFLSFSLCFLDHLFVHFQEAIHDTVDSDTLRPLCVDVRIVNHRNTCVFNHHTPSPTATYVPLLGCVFV